MGRIGRPHGLDGAFVVEWGSDDDSRYAVGAVLRVNGAPATITLSRRVGRGRHAIRLDRSVEPFDYPVGNHFRASRRSRSRSSAACLLVELIPYPIDT